jgi:hypothetical protein
MNRTSIIAMCHSCKWGCETNETATYHKAYMHAKNNSHNVSVETAIFKHYNFEKSVGASKP